MHNIIGTNERETTLILWKRYLNALEICECISEQNRFEPLMYDVSMSGCEARDET
jgi:hypothetical protein